MSEHNSYDDAVFLIFENWKQITDTYKILCKLGPIQKHNIYNINIELSHFNSSEHIDNKIQQVNTNIQTAINLIQNKLTN